MADDDRYVGWLRRYGLLEAAGTSGALVGAMVGWLATGQLIVGAIAGTVGENLGFYGFAALREARRHWRGLRRAPSPIRRRRTAKRTFRNLSLEFGPAEALDTVAVRPALLYLLPGITGEPITGFLIGKILADVVFYSVATVSRSTLLRRPRFVLPRP